MRYLCILITLITLSSCSINSKEKVVLSDHNPLNLKNSLYGLLVKDEGEYKLIKLSNQKPSKKGKSWINIKTGEPTWNIRDSYCMSNGIVELNKNHPLHKQKSYYTKKCSYQEKAIKNKTENLFFDYSIDKKRLIFMGVLTFGTAPLYVPNKYNITFNREKMDLAFKQAINNLSNEDKSNFIVLDEKYSDLKSYRENQINNYAIASTRLRNDMQININDMSGLYEEQIDLNSLVSFKFNTFKKIPVAVEGSLSNLLNKLSLQEDNLKKSWDEAALTITQECKHSSSNDFSFKFHCQKVINTDRKSAHINTVDIKSKYIKNVIVKDFNHEDDFIKQTLGGEYINISNKSKEFITIISIAFYYNEEIAIKNNLNIELPPKSTLKKINYININDFDINWGDLSFPGIIKALAEKADIKFGFAVKYSINGKNGDSSLYSTKTYKLIDFI